MKASKYNVLVSVDDDEKKVLYNTYSRKYIEINNNNKDSILNIISEPNNVKNTCVNRDIMFSMIKKGLIVSDNINEYERVKFKEYEAKYKSDTRNIVLQTTLDCNFRCAYCWQDHENIELNDTINLKLIKFIDRESRKFKNINVIWFGGEPLLKINLIMELTKAFKKICNENGCNYNAMITTNGYLFNSEIINCLDELNIRNIQITIDGDREHHNANRYLKNGDGTYDVIMKNLREILKTNVYVTLRINIDKDNYDYIENIFDEIPSEYRNRIKLSLANIFQNKERLDLYSLYKLAIEKGYRYTDTKNTFLTCENCNINGITIESTGKVTACSIAARDNKYFGYINENGVISYTNEPFYIELKSISGADSNGCKECISLPMCNGGCKYSRYKNNNICNRESADNLSLDEKIKLHYYSDMMNINL